MKKIISLLVITLIVFSCVDNKKDSNIEVNSNVESKTFNDSSYVLDDNHPLGDVRRYGIFPDSSHASGHPFTKKTRLETVLDLAENHGIEMIFPKGYYKTALIIKGRRNLNLKFDGAEFGGMVQVLEKDSTLSTNIKLKGNLISYGGFFSRNISDLDIDSLTIASDVSKSIYQIKSKGCHIYAKSENITINNLIVEDLGSGGNKFKYVHSGLTINGDNTQNVKIKKVHIKSSDRNGVFISGSDHLLEEIIIDKFGMGLASGLAGIQYGVKGEEKEFKGLWIIKCYDSFIERITINEKDSKGKYTAQFEAGNSDRPFTIGAFKILNDNPVVNINEKENSGVIIEAKE